MAKTRNLKSGEKELLAQVFVKTLPLDDIIITDKLGLGDRPYTMPMLLNNNYHVNVGDCYDKDMSASGSCEGYLSAPLLVHECTHVWQGVHGIFEWDYIANSVACQIAKGDEAYDYEPGKDWMSYGAEKQASIVEDWYRRGMLVTDDRWRYVRDNLRKPGFGGQVYFFRKGEYLRWTIDKGRDDGYPKSTKENWNSFVDESDAAFSRIVGETEYYYFFKGNEYLKWKPGSGPLDGYPKKIVNEWDSTFIADGIEAALNVDNNRVYFFKDDQYIRYTFGAGQDSGYPKKISDSWDAPLIKAGFATCGYWGNGKAYFFKGNAYSRYTIGDGVDSGYPKTTAASFNSWLAQGADFILLKRKDVF